jgi:hypothetical protein
MLAMSSRGPRATHAHYWSHDIDSDLWLRPETLAACRSHDSAADSQIWASGSQRCCQ